MIHYWLQDLIDTKGRIAAGRSPGYGGALEGHVALLVANHVDKVFSLIEDGDFGLDIAEIRAALRRAGIASAHYPIVDMDVPTAELAREIIDAVRADLDAGRTVYVHCVGGIGRTGTILGCILVEEGLSPAAAIEELRRRKPGSVQTRGQERFIEVWATPRPTLRP